MRQAKNVFTLQLLPDMFVRRNVQRQVVGERESINVLSAEISVTRIRVWQIVTVLQGKLADAFTEVFLVHFAFKSFNVFFFQVIPWRFKDLHGLSSRVPRFLLWTEQ